MWISGHNQILVYCNTVMMYIWYCCNTIMIIQQKSAVCKLEFISRNYYRMFLKVWNFKKIISVHKYKTKTDVPIAV